MKRRTLITGLVLSLAIATSACSTSNAGNNNINNNSSAADISDATYVVDKETLSDITDYESQTEGSSEAVQVDLNTVSGDYVITEEGSYALSGTLTGGKIIVNVEGQVHLYLMGVTVTSNEGSALEITGSKKKVITLVDGYTNTLTDGTSYNLEEDEANACLFSKKALTINGNGTLVLNASGSYEEEENGVKSVEYAKGLNCKDELKILNTPTIVVNAQGDGIRGKDFVEIYGGTMEITSGDDGIVSEGNINIVDGTYRITTGGGASDTAKKTDYTGSYKEIKNSTGTIYLLGGTIDINSLHNGVDSENCIYLDGSTVTVNCSSGRSERGEGSTYVHGHGVHSDLYFYAQSGSLTVTTSYEGVEAEKIYVNGGTVRVTSSDDGFNASSEANDNTACYLAINGGEVYVNASGDGLDSNGDIDITGGFIVVDGPTDNGNGALDCGDRNNTIDITGGTLACIGTAGMVENASSASTQALSNFSIADSVAAGDVIEIYSGDTKIMSFEVLKAHTSPFLQISSADISSGNTYTCKTANGTTDFEGGASASGGMGGFGGHGGMGGSREDMPEGGWGKNPQDMPGGENGDIPEDMKDQNGRPDKGSFGDFNGQQPDGSFGGQQ